MLAVASVSVFSVPLPFNDALSAYEFPPLNNEPGLRVRIAADYAPRSLCQRRCGFCL